MKSKKLKKRQRLGKRADGAPITESQGYRQICDVAKSCHPWTMAREGYEWAMQHGAEVLQKANPGLTMPQAYSRFITTDPTGRALYNASVGKAAPLPSGAVTQITQLADRLVADGIAKSRPSAIAKIAADPSHRDLWERYKAA